MEFEKYFLEHNDVVAYFTHRKDGVSVGVNNSLNLGFNTNDNIDNVYKNREIVKENLKLNDCIEIIPSQVHKADVAVIREVNSKEKYLHLGEYDAMITNCRNTLLTTGHADCAAIYIFDYKNKVIGLAHAGWKGTLENIVNETVKKMIIEFKADIKTMIGAISPCIDKCCFEVGEEVYDKFKEKFSYIDEFAVKKENKKYNLDLKGINYKQFINIGIKNIEISDFCTSCNTDIFFSHRKENGSTGRMCAGIMIK